MKFNHGWKRKEEYVTFIGINQQGLSRWRQEGKRDCRERRVWKDRSEKSTGWKLAAHENQMLERD